MNQPASHHLPEWPSRQSLLCDIRVEPLPTAADIQRAGGLLDEHHYLGAPHPVGERIWYAVLDALDPWLGVRGNPTTGRYASPDQTTFSRLMSNVNADLVEKVLLEWQRRLRGPVPPDEIVAIDGKQPKHAGGHNVVTAIATPSQHYPGCELVADKSNEVPAARKLIARLDPDGKLVSLDALHSCRQTARQLVLEAGADYAFTIKDNTPEIKKRIESRLPDPGSPLLSPQSTPAATPGTNARKRNASG